MPDILIDIAQAKIRLMMARAKGINPRRNLRGVFDLAAKEADYQSSAWASRAAAFREVMTMMDETKKGTQ